MVALPHQLPPETQAFFRRTLQILKEHNVPFIVAGAYAYEFYTGILRPTKDADLFIRPADLERAMDALADAGYEVKHPFPHWLAKAQHHGDTVDLIYRSGNGVSEVDDLWIEHAPTAEVLGVEVRLCPVEELIWTKAFIQERERSDMADVLHLLLRTGGKLDWRRLLGRFGPHWRVLLAHLTLFEFVYPGEREAVPGPVMDLLLRRLEQERREAAPAERICRGTLLSRAQFLVDIERWGYVDARLDPANAMTPGDIRSWTDAVDDAVRTR